MPTYEYKCPAGHAFEKFFPTITDKRREKCPTCGKAAERLISGGAGLVFKGSGFYITDYKNKGAQQEKKGETETKTPDAKPVESKPADDTKKKKPSGDK